MSSPGAEAFSFVLGAVEDIHTMTLFQEIDGHGCAQAAYADKSYIHIF
jgi:hypothetical protein